jgi:hypothetical protein
MLGLLLLCAAPIRARAAVEAVFQCYPDGFTLRRTGNGFVLYGSLPTVLPGTTYAISPVTGRGDGNGDATLTLQPPSGIFQYRRSQVVLDQPFMNYTWPVSHLRIRVESSTRYPGPSLIECYQRGGSQ